MTLVEPEVPSVPDQAPLAVHEVAFPVVHVIVALCPGITEVGASDSVTIAAGVGGVGVVGVVTLELQPERTKAEKRSTIASKESEFLLSAGTCITPPFCMNFLQVHFWIGRIQYRLPLNRHADM